MKIVTLLVSSIVDVNIFHFFALEVNAIWNTLYHKQDVSFVLFLQDYKDNGVHRWRKDLLNCIVPTFVYIEHLQQYCKDNNVFVKCIENVVYNGWIIDPWKFIEYSPNQIYMGLAQSVKTALGVAQTSGKYATLVTRNKSRILYDHKSNIHFENKFAEFCKEQHLPYKIICFDDISLKEQAYALADTKVMVSCHGAGNTNVFLLPDNGHLLEINFRKNWFCDPVCDPHFKGELSSTCKCKGQLTWRPYFHKADYHNLAKFFGKKYTELEMEYVESYIDRNPINVKNVYIDTKYILQHILCAMTER